MIMLVGLVLAPLPGHIGLPLLVVGLMIVLRNSFKAKRQFLRMQRAHPKMVFPIRRLMRREPEIVLVFWQQYLRLERLVLPRRAALRGPLPPHTSTAPGWPPPTCPPMRTAAQRLIRGVKRQTPRS